MFSKKKFLSELEEYIPGKSIEDTAREFRLDPKKIIKLASNENNFGPSSVVKKAIIENIKGINIYPRYPTELKGLISKYLKIPKENIVFGAGGDDVLDVLGKIIIDKNDETIITSPTFAMYEFVTRICGGRPKFIQRDENFDVPINRLLSSISKKTKMIFLCSPNNPTGNVMERKAVEKILKETRAYVYVDQAYIDFSDKKYSVSDLVPCYKNLIVLRTFSKAFALAGLRFGYGIIPQHLVKDFEKVRLPFSINNLAIVAAKAVLEDQRYLKKILRLIKEGREYLIKNIKFRTYPSQANFILVDVSPNFAKDIVFELQKKGIITRNCAIFGKGMEHFVRVSVGTLTQNKKLVRELNSFYKKLDRNFR